MHRRTFRTGLTLLTLTLLTAAACGPPSTTVETAEPAPTEATFASATVTTVDPMVAARRARGEYLVTAIGCNDCHTPFVMGPEGPEPDMSRMLSGHPAELVMPAPPVLPEGPWNWIGAATNTAYAGPWGISYAANLTPDPSGLSGMDEATFIKALRTGRHYGTSRPILPPMPWPAFRNLTDEDLGAIFEYLRSVPAIRNHVPDSVPAGQPPLAADLVRDEVRKPA